MLAVVFVLIIGLSIWQEVDDQVEKRIAKKLSEKEMLRRDSIANTIQDKRDSIANERLQKSKYETILALAQYGLKYDTAQMRIEKIVKDSSRITIIKGVEPLLKFCANSPISYKKVNNIDSVSIMVCNEGAVSRNITLRFFIFIANGEKLNPYDSLEYLFEYKGLVNLFSLGVTEWRSFVVPFNSEIENKKLHVLVTGSYTNSDASKTFKVDEAIYFNFKEGKHLFPFDGGKELREFLFKKGIRL